MMCVVCVRGATNQSTTIENVAKAINKQFVALTPYTTCHTKKHMHTHKHKRHQHITSLMYVAANNMGSI